MRVRFTKLTDATHRFEVLRDDGSSERAELETRSFLLHDLVHFAVEAEANIQDGFYGLLAEGVPFAQLKELGPGPSAGPTEPSPGLALAETLVGPLQTYFRGRDTERLSPELEARFSQLTHDGFLAGVSERMRRLQGHWRAIPYGETLELIWER